jgi:hypothetical protein
MNEIFKHRLAVSMTFLTVVGVAFVMMHLETGHQSALRRTRPLTAQPVLPPPPMCRADYVFCTWNAYDAAGNLASTCERWSEPWPEPCPDNGEICRTLWDRPEGRDASKPWTSVDRCLVPESQS